MNKSIMILYITINLFDTDCFQPSVMVRLHTSMNVLYIQLICIKQIFKLLFTIPLIRYFYYVIRFVIRYYLII